MGLDNHLQDSVMAGVIDKLDGASNYANDSSNPSAFTSQTLACRAKSKEEILDLKTLLRQKEPHLHCSKEDEKDEATHVVVGVFYGAQIYCVLTNDLGDEEEESRVKILPKFTTEWRNSLEESQDFIQFQEKFDKLENQQLSQIKCRIYSDLNTEPVREVNVFEAYKQSQILIDHVKNSSKELVPIAVLLCPLDVIMGPKERQHIEFYDIDDYLVSRCYRVMGKLDRIRVKADALLTSVKLVHRPRLRRFAEAIAKYQEVIKNNLKDAVIEARKTNDIAQLDIVAEVAENHLLFRPSHLKRWLYYEEAEVEMTEKFVIDDERITFAADDDDYEDEDEDQSYALTLYVPSLNEMKFPFLHEMEKWVQFYNCYNSMVGVKLNDADDYDQDGETTEDEEEKDGISFQHVEFRRRILQWKLNELTDHIRRNEGNVRYFVRNSRSQETKCSYCLWYYSQEDYEDYERKSTIENFQLPKPPTNLRILPEATDKTKKAKRESVSIEWDDPYCPDFDQEIRLPHYYIVEYRSKGSTVDWKRQKSEDELQATIFIGKYKCQ